jgi:hypothetical protein
MVELKLGRLPERTPVKLAVTVMPELHNALLDYAAIYNATYNSAETAADLIPHMLSAFLAGDRGFQKERGTRTNG